MACQKLRASGPSSLLAAIATSVPPDAALIDGAMLGERLVIGTHFSQARRQPGPRSSQSRYFPTDSVSAGRQDRFARPHAQVYISGLTRHCWRPDLHCKQSSYRPWFPRLPTPRTAAHFAFVSSVELDEQTTSPSRTATLSGASPDFPFPNPLSGMVLIMLFSIHFREFQALRALAGSYSPNALAGNYTLLLSAR